MSEKPFTQRWLNNAYQDSLQPTSQWQRASHLLAERLANSIEAEPAFSQSDRFKQMTFQLLGEVFVRNYFPHDSIDPGVITPPNIAWEDRRTLETDCKAWLDAKLQACIDTLPPEASQAVSQFQTECSQLVGVGLDKELYRRQVNYMRDPKKADAAWTAPPPTAARQAGSRATAVTADSDSTGADTAISAQPKGPHEPYDARPPVYSSFHAEHCAESLAAVLRSNPDRLPEFCDRLRGRRLPQAMRQFVWREGLFKAERKRSGQWNVERFFRERFGKTVARGVGELKIKRATQSPINNLLENAVIETYEKTSATKELNNALFLTEAVRVLNVLYVYDKSYEPFLILWLVPLQVAFRDEASATDLGEQVYELAMLLSLLHQGTYPGWPTVFAIAERSLELVKEADPEFHAHLIDIATKNIEANLKDFMVQVIHEEFERAQSLLRTHSDSPRQQRLSKNVLVNPAIFLRKWIGEGFVGVLSLHAAMFYWDQCFLTDFASATIEDAALAALFLLRNRFMSAKDYPEMKSVFLTGPREIYTADFIRAWCHLQDRGDPTLVPEMNRRKLVEPPPPDPDVRSPTPVPATPLQPTPLPGLWIDLVSLRLQLIKDGARQKLLASSFTEEHLAVRIHRRYGSVGLHSHLLNQRGDLQPVEDREDFRSLQLAYNDKCDFPEVDVAQYDLESDMGRVPYLLVQLHYEPPDSEPVVLGWARVAPYERLSNGQFAAAKRFRVTCPIYPGYLPDDPLGWEPGEFPDFDEDDPEERQQAADYRDGLVNAYLGDFSEISLHGYPIKEAASPLVILPPPPPPTPPPAEPAKAKTPSPLPPEPAPPDEEPEPVRQPKDIPRRHWTIHDPAIEKTYPEATGTSQPFDLYIDQVRYMFDGITIVKLTGRFLNTGHDTEIPDILLVPNPKVSPRNLNFFAGQRVQVAASDTMNLGKDSVLVIRVYTLIKPDLELVVVGTCALPVFDQQGRLRTGGHQLRLREHAAVVASNSGQQSSLSANLDAIRNARGLPCVTALFRLHPRTFRSVEAPDYTGGYYRSEECRPNDKELRLFREHDRYETYPETFAPLISYVQSRDGVKATANDYNQVMAYVPRRMDPARCLPANTAPKAMPKHLYFHYRAVSGAFVRLEAAFGLPSTNAAAGAAATSDLTFGVLMTLIGAKQLDSIPSKALGIGYDTMAVFVQSAGGRFTRRAEQLCPRADLSNALLVQFFRLPAVSHRAGKIYQGEQEVTELRKEHFVAWAVCPLLNEEFTYNGRHRVPVFNQSDLPLTTARVRTMRSRGLTGGLKTDGALAGYVATSSALLSVVDGHFDYKEAPENAAVHTSVYQYLPKTTPTDYQRAIDAAQTESSSFGQDCQEAVDNLISATQRKKYEPLFVAA